MAEKIYLSDSYAREVDAIVASVSSNEVMLDKTVFYPAGGGQPCDTGVIGTYKVAETKKAGDDVAHMLETEPNFKPGDTVHCAIDWEKRYMHMRFHTALHIIDGVVEKLYHGRITGGQIYDDKARMDFDVPGLDRAKAMEILQSSQKVANENHKVTVRFLSKEEAQKIPNLARTEPGEGMLGRLDRVRIIDIEGFDFQLDGGTHVASTSEVGSIEMSKYENKGSRNKRIEIVLK